MRDLPCHVAMCSLANEPWGICSQHGDAERLQYCVSNSGCSKRIVISQIRPSALLHTLNACRSSVCGNLCTEPVGSATTRYHGSGFTEPASVHMAPVNADSLTPCEHCMLHCYGCLTQTLGDIGVICDAVKGQATPRQPHDVETRCRTPVQHQLCVLVVKLLAVICCGDELHTEITFEQWLVMPVSTCSAAHTATYPHQDGRRFRRAHTCPNGLKFGQV
jgi:hypothetical protein